MNEECNCKCDPKEYKKPVSLPSNYQIDFSEWYDISRKYWLTIGDILKIKPGATVKLLTLDRNVGDRILEKKRGVYYTPHDFFEFSTMTWTKKKGIYGVFDDGINAFELYVDNKCIWHPLEYESMEDLLTGQWSPHSSHSSHFKRSCLPGQMSIDNCKSWTSYPLDTLAGWRGPMILWENVAKLPMVRYRFKKDGYSFK